MELSIGPKGAGTLGQSGVGMSALRHPWGPGTCSQPEEDPHKRVAEAGLQ